MAPFFPRKGMHRIQKKPSINMPVDQHLNYKDPNKKLDRIVQLESKEEISNRLESGTHIEKAILKPNLLNSLSSPVSCCRHIQNVSISQYSCPAYLLHGNQTMAIFIFTDKLRESNFTLFFLSSAMN